MKPLNVLIAASAAVCALNATLADDTCKSDEKKLDLSVPRRAPIDCAAGPVAHRCARLGVTLRGLSCQLDNLALGTSDGRGTTP